MRSILKKKEVEKVVKSTEVIGVDDETAKEVAIALLKGDVKVLGTEYERGWMRIKEKVTVLLDNKYTVTIEHEESY